MTHSSRNLSVWLKQQDPVIATEVWSLLAAGLSFLARYHHHGLVYGNLSPSMLTYDQTKWHILTLGTAELAPPDPEYTAPEQLQGQPCLGSDLYSLGLITLQLLTGKPPFSFFPLSPEQLITESFTNLHPPDISPVSASDQAMHHRSLRLFLQKLIHPDPTQRFTDALTAHRHLPKSEQYNYPLVDLDTVPLDRATPKPTRSEPQPNQRQTNSWQCLRELWGHDGYSPQINAVSFLGTAHLISASDDRTLKIWHCPSGICTQTLRVHTSFVKALAVAPNHNAFASGGADGSLVIHHIAQEDTLPQSIPDSTIQLTHTIAAHSQTINAIVFSPNSQQIITASADKSIGIWCATKGNLLYRLPHAHDLGILSLAISANGKYIATGSSDRTVKIWRLESPTTAETTDYALNLVHQIRHHTWGVSAVAFSDDGEADSQWLATGGQDNMIYLWSMAQIQNQRPIAQTLQTTIKGHSWTIAALVFTAKQHLWSASWDKTIKCWDIPQCQNRHTLKGHTNSVSALAWSPDHTYLASGSYDATVRLWQQVSIR